MDPRYHIAALREVRLMVNGVQSVRCAHACAAIRCKGKNLESSSRRSAGQVDGVCAGDRHRDWLDHRNQASISRKIDRS